MWVNELLRADSSPYAALTQAGTATLPRSDMAAARQALTCVAAAGAKAALRLQADGDGAALGGILDGVRQQVDQHLDEPVAIHQRVCVCRFRFAVDGCHDAQPRGKGTKLPHGALDQWRQRLWLRVKGHEARFDLGDVEHVGDQAGQPLAVASGQRHHLCRARRQFAAAAAFQQLQRAADGGERRAQLVAHRVHKVVFQPCQTLAFAQPAQLRRGK